MGQIPIYKVGVSLGQLVLIGFLGFKAAGLKQNNLISHITGEALDYNYAVVAIEGADNTRARQVLDELAANPHTVRALTPSVPAFPGVPPTVNGPFSIGYYTIKDVNSSTWVQSALTRLEPLETGGVTTHMTGDAAINYFLDRESQSTRLIFACLVCFALLSSWFVTRSIAGVAVTAISVGTPLAATMGLYALLGFELDLLTNLLPVLILVLGFAMHMHVFLAIARCGSVREGLKRKLKANFIVTATTSAGFLSLFLSQLPPIRVLGIFMAISMWLCLGSVYLTHWSIGWMTKERAVTLPSLWHRVTHLLRIRPQQGLWVGVGACVIVVGAFCVLRTPVQSNGLFYFHEDHPVRIASQLLAPITGISALELEPTVEGRISLGAIRKTKGVRYAFWVPREKHIVLMVDAMDAETFAAFQTSIASYGKISGPLVLVSSFQQKLIRSLTSSLLASIALISLLLMLVVPLPLGPAVAWLPNLFPLGCMGIAMALFGIEISVATVLVFSIAFGIAVDDTIHLSVKYLQSQAENPWQDVLQTEGVAVLVTSVILTVGFAAVGLSPFKPLSDFGKLLSIGMITAMLGDFLILPAILKHYKRPQRRIDP